MGCIRQRLFWFHQASSYRKKPQNLLRRFFYQLRFIDRLKKSRKSRKTCTPSFGRREVLFDPVHFTIPTISRLQDQSASAMHYGLPDMLLELPADRLGGCLLLVRRTAKEVSKERRFVPGFVVYHLAQILRIEPFRPDLQHQAEYLGE
jgi:hypothetical protein